MGFRDLVFSALGYGADILIITPAWGLKLWVAGGTNYRKIRTRLAKIQRDPCLGLRVWGGFGFQLEGFGSGA